MSSKPTSLIGVLKGRGMSVVGFIKSERGQSVVELALVFPLFALVFFAIVEFSHLFYVKLTLQHALREAGRYAVTGRAEEKGTRPEAIQEVFCKNLIGTGLSCREVRGEFALNPADGGGSGDIVTLTATFEKAPFTLLIGRFFTDRKVTFRVSTTWKNEPFA